jgi:hypothetical protein
MQRDGMLVRRQRRKAVMPARGYSLRRASARSSSLAFSILPFAGGSPLHLHSTSTPSKRLLTDRSGSRISILHFLQAPGWIT